jgi:imidazolonepropionase-like amidohydrolase
MRRVGVLLSIVVLVAGACGDGGTDTPVSGTTGPASATEGEPVTAFVNVVPVPMTADVTVPDQTVLVAADRIVGIGASSEVDVPDGAVVIDGGGAYLMPGLADMHIHLSDAWPVPELDLYLAKGVTTVRNLNAVGPFVLEWRDSVNAGTRRGPKIFTAGPTIYLDAENLDGVVEDQLAQGYDFIKLYSFLSAEGFREAMAAVRQKAAYTIGHIPFAVGLDGVVAEGMNEVAHVEELDFELLDLDRNVDLGLDDWLPYVFERFDEQLQSTGFDELLEERVAQVVATLNGADIPVATTLVVADVIVEKLLRPDGFLAREESKYLPEAYLASFQAGEETHQMQWAGNEDKAAVRYAIDLTLLAALHEAGNTLVLGTDAGSGGMGLIPGFTIHDELGILTSSGLTPYEAIRTGTANASAAIEAMTGINDFGTVEIGKRADLLLVGGNPLEDISHIEAQLRGVMAAGTWYPQAELSQMIAYNPVGR